MTKARRWVMLPLSLMLATMLAFSTFIPVVLAGSDSGNLNCLAGKSVRIYSTASVEVWHLWASHAQYFLNQTPTLRYSYTGLQSTWWTVSWSASSNGQGATCIQVGLTG